MRATGILLAMWTAIGAISWHAPVLAACMAFFGCIVTLGLAPLVRR